MLAAVAFIFYDQALKWTAVITLLYVILGAMSVLIYYQLGRGRVLRWEARDWASMSAQADGMLDGEVHHIVLLPNYNEPIEMLEQTLASLAAQHNARAAISVVMAMEAAEEGARGKAQWLAAAFGSAFAHFLVTLHPPGLPGETPGKGSNLAWAIRTARRVLIEQYGIPTEHCTLTSLDADARLHRQYFAALGARFAADPARYHRFWQAPLSWHSNVQQLCAPVQMVTSLSSVHFWASLANPFRQTFPLSTYSLSLRLAEEAGYWDPAVISEDWHMYLRAFFATQGAVSVETIYLPTVAEALEGQGLWEGMVNRYRQTVRHAWGAEEFGTFLRHSALTPGISWIKTLRHGASLLHDHVAGPVGLAVILLALLASALTPADPLSLLVAGLYGSLAAGFGLMWLFDAWYYPEPPGGRRMFGWLPGLMSWLLLPLVFFTLNALPAIQAQTRLLLGMPARFAQTPRGVAEIEEGEAAIAGD